MAATSLHDVFQAIGSLKAQVEGLRRDIDGFERRASAENREVDEKRAIVHRRIDEIITDVGEIKTDIAVIKEDVQDSKAVTDEVKKWKLMGIGALGVVGLAGTALGVSLASSFEWVARLFHR